MENGALYALDQTLLPAEERYVRTDTLEACEDAIKKLRVRGAPLIGVYAAYALCVCLDRGEGSAEHIARRLIATRPTAVNLEWAVNRVMRFAPDMEAMFAEARAIHEEDIASCAAIGEHGAALIREGDGVLTHCNAGALATSGMGTALSPIYTAWGQGKRFSVFADETRPLLQGARLTAWELNRAGVPVTLLCDNAAASLMRSGRIGLCVVGADRIARNGDAANKIGTLGVALLAKAHGIPFYVAAPFSTIDTSLPDGSGIPIEFRAAREVTHPMEVMAAPDVPVYSPAFDVTDAPLIAGIITEKGVFRPPYNFFDSCGT